MSQSPPPPPSQPAPAGGTPAASNSKTNVILAYLLWWITGLIFLFVGKDDPDVKWNAAQSVVVLGGIWLIGLIVSIIYAPVGYLVYLVAFVYWIIFLIGAFNYQGGHIKAPGIAQYTDQLTDQLANAVK
ncbi:MAG TPA: hypothetical protein VGX27_04465 [Candidatus Dormibacteraeota bacterium]|nr:hypothetical protein [Candidatus Dormibacteraeota bacterium]